MATETVFRILFLILLGGVMGMRIYFMVRVRQAGERVMPDREAIGREGRGAFAARFVGFLLLLAFLVLYIASPASARWARALSIPLPGWLRWLGFGLGLASLTLWIWAQTALGKEWSPQLQLREEHHLTTTGPYALVRHPIYTAMFGYGASLALVTANWVFVFLAVLVIAGLVARVPKEEQMMIEEFGGGYRAYAQRTGRFFPR
jgi:protein-S-isoprenylcysteine O-methyltransferase Ste14